MNGQEIIILIQGEQLQKAVAPFPAPLPYANGMFFFLILIYILSNIIRCKAYGERDIWTASFVIV